MQANKVLPTYAAAVFSRRPIFLANNLLPNRYTDNDTRIQQCECTQYYLKLIVRELSYHDKTVIYDFFAIIHEMYLHYSNNIMTFC